MEYDFAIETLRKTDIINNDIIRQLKFVRALKKKYISMIYYLDKD